MIKRTMIAMMAAAMSVAVTAAAPLPERATGFADRPAIAVGTAWYPEQWPEARWATDLAMMRKAGVTPTEWNLDDPRNPQGIRRYFGELGLAEGR